MKVNKSVRIESKAWDKVQQLCTKLGYKKTGSGGKPSIPELLEAIADDRFFTDYLNYLIKKDRDTP